jgi:hypothetical protein
MPIPATPTDPYIGETYRSTDARDNNRRIRIETTLTTKHGTRYSALVITDDGNPGSVGKHTDLSAATLEKYYEKVSH